MAMDKKQLHPLLVAKCQELTGKKEISASDIALIVYQQTGESFTKEFYGRMPRKGGNTEYHHAKVLAKFLGINASEIAVQERKKKYKTEKTTYEMFENLAFETAKIGRLFHSRLEYKL